MDRRDFLRHSAAASGALWAGMPPGHAASGAPKKAVPKKAANGHAPKAEHKRKPSDAPADPWVRPGPDDPRPIWGIRGGIQVGLWPASVEGPGAGGPRGLLRIGYPILDGGKGIGLVNFIAVEPIVNRRRGFSELERSDTDGQPGRFFGTGEKGQVGAAPDPGTIRRADGTEYLSVRVHTERFANGALPIVDLEFRADRPGEVRLTASSAPGSAAMEYCVLTATMGNYARLRQLWLRDGMVQAGHLWPGFTGNEFTDEAFFPQDRFYRMPGGDLVVCATSNEANPNAVRPDPVAPGWAYRGSFPLTQYWRKPKDRCDISALRVRVNGRQVYWASHNPIPGGLAYENFDLMEPFCEGQAFVFGLTWRSPADVVRGMIL